MSRPFVLAFAAYVLTNWVVMGTSLKNLFLSDPIPINIWFFLSPIVVPPFLFPMLFAHWIIWTPFLAAFILFSLTAIAPRGQGVLIYLGLLLLYVSGLMSMTVIASV